VNPYANPQAYRESSVLTASPGQLVVMLYDGVGRFLRQAQAALAQGSWQEAHDRLGRAEAIINELSATLDMEQGLIAERLEAIYAFCGRCLVEARIQRDAEKIGVVVRLFGELREAWAQVATGGSLAVPAAVAQVPAQVA
jgi:flagellar protein FliS